MAWSLIQAMCTEEIIIPSKGVRIPQTKGKKSFWFHYITCTVCILVNKGLRYGCLNAGFSVAIYQQREK